MKQVQIHYTRPDGRTGVMNYLPSDNTELGSASRFEYHRKRKLLLDKATRMASQWYSVYPDWSFKVKEV